MDGWFELAMPWWQFAVRGAAAYLGLLVLMRAAGKHAFGEMSPFDIVVLIVVGGTVRTAIIGDDTSVLGPFIAIASILIVDSALARLAAASPWCNRIIEGRAAMLAKAGALLPGRLERHAVARTVFEREMRAHGVRSVADIDEARLEANGRISFLIGEHHGQPSR
ncbi:MAG TPA: YetF domain-containing protein [Dokdonella sp.]|nr:YetF domain-containing protein [Dokdonella sp.]